MPLTAATAKSAQPTEKDYKLSDGKGLYLLVKNNGAKYWRLKFRFNGKEKTLALGVFPEVTLAMARMSRDEARLKINSGIDPSQVRQAQRKSRIGIAENSFEVIAREWLVNAAKNQRVATSD